MRPIIQSSTQSHTGGSPSATFARGTRRSAGHGLNAACGAWRASGHWEIGDFTNTNWGKWEIIGMQVMDIDVGYILTMNQLESTI
jgi:hypothetical protein